MTIWVLVHRSTVAADEVTEAKLLGFFTSAAAADEAAASSVERIASYAEMPDGFERFVLPLDEEIATGLSDRIIWGPGDREPIG